jgi:hypothetical protein
MSKYVKNFITKCFAHFGQGHLEQHVKHFISDVGQRDR